MSGVADQVLSLSGVTAYVVVAALAFAECGTLLGLVLPGELAVMLGGVLAFQGKVDLWVMMAVAVVAAIAGDTVGYELGRRYGARLLGTDVVQRRFGDQVDRATDYLRERGTRAVLIGRWTSLFRTLVPPLAGSSHMPYGRFAVANAAGGVPWAVTFVLLGYVAGASWRRVEATAGRASILLLVVVVTAFVLRAGARWLAGRQDRVVELLHRVGRRPAVVGWVERHRATLSFVAERFRPGVLTGLGLTLTAVVAVGASWLLGGVVQDVVAGDELVVVDARVQQWVATHGAPTATRIADAWLAPVTWPWALPAVLAVAAVGWRVADRGTAGRLAVGSVSSVVVATAARAVVGLRAGAVAFPAVSMAMVVSLAVPVTVEVGRRRGWPEAVRAAAALGFLAVVTGVAALVAGTSALSGVLAGAAIGLLLPAVVELVPRVRRALAVATTSAARELGLGLLPTNQLVGSTTGAEGHDTDHPRDDRHGPGRRRLHDHAQPPGGAQHDRAAHADRVRERDADGRHRR